MARRLVLSFVVVTLALLALAGVLRSYTAGHEERERENAHVVSQATALAALVQERRAAGRPVDAAVLADLAHSDSVITYDAPGAPQVVVHGSTVDPESDDLMAMTVPLSPGTVTYAERERSWTALLTDDPPSLLVLLLLVVVLAGLAGLLVARWITAPFTALAGAAAMLGRGRFDLDLPRTGVREVQEVSSALEASAQSLRERLAREQQFAQHTSHVLRTPLTGLRLHLDELDQADLDPEARDAAERCLRAVDRLDQVVADLVAVTRGGALMAGAEVPLRELATASAQRWADVLIGDGRTFTAAVEGDLDLRLTPGPVEYVLDVLLEQARRETGAVRLVLHGEPSVLRLEVSGLPAAAVQVGRGAVEARLEEAESFLASMGGRLQALPDGSGVRVLVPAR